MGKAVAVCEYCWLTHFVVNVNNPLPDGTGYSHTIRQFFILQDENRNKIGEKIDDLELPNTVDKLTLGQIYDLIADNKTAIKEAAKDVKYNSSGYQDPA